MKLVKLVAATALAFAVPAIAQDAGVAVGAMVYGPQGNEVGTIEKVAGDVVVLDTGAHKATLPATVFGKGEKGPIISMTKADLDAAIEKADADAAAALKAALVAGADLHSLDNVVLGKVTSVADDGSTAVVDITDHGPVTLKSEQMAVANGQLVFRATAAQLRAALPPAAPAAS